jgi:hypothetical protein
VNEGLIERLDADDLVSQSGYPRGHVYEKASADYAEPVVDWWSLDGKLSEARIEQLDAGEEPTKEEAKLLWKAHMRHRFEEPDDDIMPAVWFCRCPPGIDLPPLIVVLCYGHSFTGVSRLVFGAFENEASALAALQQEFYLPEDFESEC